ncbi:hypothetical protein CLF_101799, partial [Clonorchis sinensis]
MMGCVTNAADDSKHLERVRKLEERQLCSPPITIILTVTCENRVHVVQWLELPQFCSPMSWGDDEFPVQTRSIEYIKVLLCSQGKRITATYAPPEWSSFPFRRFPDIANITEAYTPSELRRFSTKHMYHPPLTAHTTSPNIAAQGVIHSTTSNKAASNETSSPHLSQENQCNCSSDRRTIHCGADVRPLLSYVNQVIYSGRKEDATFTDHVQRAAMKMVVGLKSVDYGKRLVVLDLIPLEHRRLRGDKGATGECREAADASRIRTANALPATRRLLVHGITGNHWCKTLPRGSASYGTVACSVRRTLPPKGITPVGSMCRRFNWRYRALQNLCLHWYTCHRRSTSDSHPYNVPYPATFFGCLAPRDAVLEESFKESSHLKISLFRVNHNLYYHNKDRVRANIIFDFICRCHSAGRRMGGCNSPVSPLNDIECLIQLPISSLNLVFMLRESMISTNDSNTRPAVFATAKWICIYIRTLLFGVFGLLMIDYPSALKPDQLDGLLAWSDEAFCRKLKIAQLKTADYLPSYSETMFGTCPSNALTRTDIHQHLSSKREFLSDKFHISNQFDVDEQLFEK